MINKLINKKKFIKGRIIGIDLLLIKKIKFVEFIQGNFCEKNTKNYLEFTLNNYLVNVILCDITNNISGIKFIDEIYIKKFFKLIIYFIYKYIKNEGSFIIKTFHSKSFLRIFKYLKYHFHIVCEIKTNSSYSNSSETFLIIKKLKNFKYFDSI